MAEVSAYNPSMLLWIDESGCDLRNCIRKRGYSVRGMTPQNHRLGGVRSNPPWLRACDMMYGRIV